MNWQDKKKQITKDLEEVQLKIVTIMELIGDQNELPKDNDVIDFNIVKNVIWSLNKNSVTIKATKTKLSKKLMENPRWAYGNGKTLAKIDYFTKQGKLSLTEDGQKMLYQVEGDRLNIEEPKFDDDAWFSDDIETPIIDEDIYARKKQERQAREKAEQEERNTIEGFLATEPSIIELRAKIITTTDEGELALLEKAKEKKEQDESEW